jgi:O-antigen/teichoic acid export membrane protein
VKAVRNGLWNAGANVIGIATGLIGTLIIPRSLPTTDEYGMFSYYMWLAGILGVLGSLGLPNALTKISSELRGKQTQDQAQSLSKGITLLILIVNLLLAFGLLWWGLESPSPDRYFLFIIAVLIVPKALAAVLRSTLMGEQRYKPVSLNNTLGSILQLILIILVSLTGWGAAGFVGAMLFATAAQSAGLFYALWKPTKSLSLRLGSFIPSRPTLERYFTFLLPSTLVLLTNQIVWERSETFFLAWNDVGLDQIGFYSMGYTVFSMFYMLGGALLNAFFPSISYDYGAGNWDGIREKVRKGTILATVYAVPLSLGGWATLDRLIPLLCTPKMYPSADVAKILFMSLLPASMGVILGFVLGATSGIWMSVRLGLVVSVVNVTLDILLIPVFEATGAAIASTTAQVVYVGLMYFFVRRMYQIELPFRNILAIIGMGTIITYLIPTLVQIWIPSLVGLFLGIILAAGLYILMLWFLGYINMFLEKDDDIASESAAPIPTPPTFPKQFQG